MVDRSGLVSAKPERASHELASRIRGNRILDVFTGLGMSAIACARAGKQVVCIDTNTDRLEFAKHNARIYIIQNNHTFIASDLRHIMREAKQREFDAVILDPPYNPIQKDKDALITLDDFTPPAHHLLQAAASCASQIAFLIPLNFDLNQLKRFAHNIQINDAIVGDDVRYRTALLWN